MSQSERPPALQIGRVRIEPPIVQAPMSAITTLPMRTLSEDQGCGLTVTEFLPAAAIAAKNKKTLRRITKSNRGRPFGVQIYGRDPDQIRRAAARVADMGAAIVDINMGCPGKKVSSGSCGAALMREPELACQIVRAAIEGVDGGAEVTVKMRTGWDDDSVNAPELAQRVEGEGAVAVTVHGRTRQQRYTGTVNLDTIAEVKRRLHVPVLVNGDITDVPSLERALWHTATDGAMVGRAAMGNPWIFSTFAAWWYGRSSPSAPTAYERVTMFRRHLDLHLASDDAPRAVIEMRKFAAWYLNPVADSQPLRDQINRLTSGDAIREALTRFAEGLLQQPKQPLLN